MYVYIYAYISIYLHICFSSSVSFLSILSLTQRATFNIQSSSFPLPLTLNLFLFPFPISDALFGSDVADFEGEGGFDGAAVEIFERLFTEEDEVVVDDALQDHTEDPQHSLRSVLPFLKV